MKTMMIFLLLLFTVSNLEAQEELQEETLLDEVNVIYTHKIKTASNVEGYELEVREDYRGQFAENPVKFCDEIFDIQALIDYADPDEYDIYEIALTNRKGFIKAVYDDEGNLQRTFQKFKNIALPNKISQGLVRDHKGWSMTANKYVARGKENKVHKEKYLIYMQKGDDSKTVKITPSISSERRLTGNERP